MRKSLARACAVHLAAPGKGGVMKVDVWRRRGPLMYTVGAWTLFGSIFYYCSGYVGDRQEDEVQPSAGKETGPAISEDGLAETTTSRIPGRSFYAQTTTVYTPNFVPYTIRLHNYVQSFFDNSGNKGK